MTPPLQARGVRRPLPTFLLLKEEQGSEAKRRNPSFSAPFCPRVLCATDVMGWNGRAGCNRPGYSARICLIRAIARRPPARG